jgi:hypothetical protein
LEVFCIAFSGNAHLFRCLFSTEFELQFFSPHQHILQTRHASTIRLQLMLNKEIGSDSILPSYSSIRRIMGRDYPSKSFDKGSFELSENSVSTAGECFAAAAAAAAAATTTSATSATYMNCEHDEQVLALMFWNSISPQFEILILELKFLWSGTELQSAERFPMLRLSSESQHKPCSHSTGFTALVSRIVRADYSALNAHVRSSSNIPIPPPDLCSTVFMSPPAQLLYTARIMSPSNGDLLSFFGSVGGFLGLVGALNVFVLGQRTSILSPGFFDLCCFKGHLSAVLARVLPAQVLKLMKQRKIDKAEDGESFFMTNDDEVELQTSSESSQKHSDVQV